MSHPRIARFSLLVASLAGAPALGDQSTKDLARYFGFEEPRIVVVDDRAGPALAADMNADGLTDLIVVNNIKSRIELHLQRRTARTQLEIEREFKVNELPPSPYFDRVDVSVSHRVDGFRARDVDGDGMLDLLYSGSPSELVILRQVSPSRFDLLSKRRVKNLSAGHDGLEIADVTGDAGPELLVLAQGRINIFGLSSDAVVGEPIQLGSGGSGQEIVAIFTEDYNGDGLTDILAAVPDDLSPTRLWLQSPGGSGTGKSGQLGPELRFEMPQLRELEPVRFPGLAAASIATIERPTRRIVLNDLKEEGGSAAVVASGERDAAAEVYTFPGDADKARSGLVADIDADGLVDLVVSDQQGNTVLFYRQQSGSGLGAPARFSSLKDPRAIAAGQWDADPELELFALSEADKVVGVSNYDRSSGALGFPQPIALATSGASPVSMTPLTLSSGPALAVVVKDKRDHTLEIHRPAGSSEVLKLEGVSRPPQSGLAGDFDHDGSMDLVLFTPSEPLIMVRSIDGSSSEMKLLTDKSMPQFGLVQAAGPENTALLDVDRNGFSELLIATQNFIRACEFSAEKGWRVVEQVTLPEASANLTSMTVLPVQSGALSIAATDKANKRLVIVTKLDRGWDVTERLRFSAFDPTNLYAGSYSGVGSSTGSELLATSASAFAVIRVGGGRMSLDEVAAYRSDAEDRIEHEIEVGDLNSDGFTDLVVLDAKEQMCQIYSFSRSRRLFLATEFQVFESRLFGGGDDREFEPSAAIIADMTGDGRVDLVLQVHDRYMIFPQMSGPAAAPSTQDSR